MVRTKEESVTTERWSPLERRLAALGGRDKVPRVIADDRTVPASELLPAARSVARRLLADGLDQGDLVLLLLRNSVEYLAAAVGVMLAGGIVVPVNARFTPAEVRFFFEHGRPRATIAEQRFAELLRSAEGLHPPDLRYVVDLDVDMPLKQLHDWESPGDLSRPVTEIDAEQTAAIFFTAGTTGPPKGARTSHQAIDAFNAVVEHSMGVDERDCVVLPMPMFYTGGLKAPLAVLSAGADLVVFREWRAPDLVDAIDAYAGTLLWAVPSVWGLMMRGSSFDPGRVQSVRILWRGGSLTPTRIVEDLVETFPELPHFQSYGLTECNMSTMEKDSVRYDESCGFATHGTRVTIEGADVREEPGEIWVRGAQQFSGYFGDPARTRQTLVDGWVRTGDQGWIGGDGRLHVLGRGSDIVIRGGENISTTEVERVLVNVVGVDEAAVLGVPDDIFGHELRAVVVSSSPEVTEASIRKVCEDALAEFKVPRFIEIRDEPLPKSAVGKIQKRLLL